MFPVRNGIRKITICENCSISRPFPQDQVNLCDRMPDNKCLSTILIRLINKFGKSLTFMQQSFHPDYLAKL